MSALAGGDPRDETEGQNGDGQRGPVRRAKRRFRLAVQHRALLKEMRHQAFSALPVWFVGVLTNWMPENRITLRLRGWMLRPFLRSCGRRLEIGAYVTLRETHNLALGDDVYIAKGAWLDATGGLTLGSEVMLAPYVVISTAQHVVRDGSARFAGGIAAPVSIGRGTWVAAHVTITSGAIIGQGCLIAANACVTDAIPDGFVAGGVPARPISPVVERPPAFFSRRDRL